MPLPQRDMRFWIQAALLTATVVFLAIIAFEVSSNLQRRSLHLGLDFLNRPAGFSILQTLIPFNETSTYGRAFFVGLLNTLLVAVMGIVAATVVGFSVGFARLAPNRVVRWVSTAYVEFLRNLPLLLILFFLYFGILRQLPPPRQSFMFAGSYLNNRGLFMPLPLLYAWQIATLSAAAVALFMAVFTAKNARIPLLCAAASAVFMLFLRPWDVSWPEPRGLSIAGGAKLIPEFVALATALAIYTAAYIAEIVRAGIEGVAKGQGEAAEALGFSAWQRARLIILPQALRLIIPPLTSQYLNLTKNSSLAVAIAYPDLVSVFAGTTLAQTGQAVEIIGITMLVYLTLSLATAFTLSFAGPHWR